MSRIRPVALLIAAALLAAGAPVTAAAGPMPAAAHAQTETTPDLLPMPEDAVDTSAAAIDGSLVVGTASDREAGTRAVAWDISARPAVITELGTPAGPSRATGVSGRLVVGMAVLEDGGSPVPVVWTLGGEPVRARAIGGADDIVDAVAGSLAVGRSTDGRGTTAVAWDLTNPARPVRIALDPERRFAESAAAAVSGMTVAGTVFDGWSYRAAAWDLAHGAPVVTLLDTSDADSAAYAVGDRFVAGYRDTGNGPRPTTWDLSTGATGRTPAARALAAGLGTVAVATDGDLVAGNQGDAPGRGSARVWDITASGPVAHPLTTGRGATTEAAGVSGRTVAGTVTSARGRTTAATWTVGVGRVEIDGLLGPIAGGGVVNTVTAGQVIPLRFRLHVAGGSGVDVDGLRTRVVSQVAVCPPDAARVPVEASVRDVSGIDGYGDGLYRVTWAAGAASGSCREVVVTVDGPSGLELEGASMRALFEVVP